MIAGQLPTTPGALSPGSGPVDIYANQIQANLANDDGGGIRFLMAGNFPMNVYNNMIVNNVSTHEGGGIALNDAPNVRVFNNTIMKNLTTATAVTSNGTPAPAGLSTSANSDQLQATLPAGRRRSATRCCSTTSSGTTGPAPAPGPRSPASALAGDAARSTTGTSASPTAPGAARADQLDRPAGRRRCTRTRRARRTVARTRTWSPPTTCRSSFATGGRTRPSSTPRS